MILYQALAEFLTLLDESILYDFFHPEVRSSLAKSKSVMPPMSTKKGLGIQIFILKLPEVTFKKSAIFLHTFRFFPLRNKESFVGFKSKLHKYRHTSEILWVCF